MYALNSTQSPVIYHVPFFSPTHIHAHTERCDNSSSTRISSPNSPTIATCYFRTPILLYCDVSPTALRHIYSYHFLLTKHLPLTPFPPASISTYPVDASTTVRVLKRGSEYRAMRECYWFLSFFIKYDISWEVSFPSPLSHLPPYHTNTSACRHERTWGY